MDWIRKHNSAISLAQDICLEFLTQSNKKSDKILAETANQIWANRQLDQEQGFYLFCS